MFVVPLAAALAVLEVTASPAPPAPSVATSSPVPVLNDGELLRLIVASIAVTDQRFGGKLIVQTKPPSEMPADDPFVHYAGRGPNGEGLIWQSSSLGSTEDHALLQAQDDAVFAAMLGMAMDRGVAGERWQRTYSAAPDKLALTRALVQQWSALRAREFGRSRADIAWLRERARPGTSRAQLYALLKSRGVETPNEPQRRGGETAANPCDLGFLTGPASPSPGGGRSLANDPCVQLLRPKPTTTAGTHAPVSIKYPLNMWYGCATSITQTFTFGPDDRLLSVNESPERTDCI